MATSPKQNELVQLQQDITREVNSDAPAIAQGIFGDNKNHPDMAQVSNQQLDQLYVQKYQEGDRQWLQAEARRDPNQFMDIAKRIGVTMPNPTAPPVPTLDHAALAQNLMANAAPTGPAPGLPPAPPVSPGLPAALPPPAALPAPMPAPVAGPVGAPVALAPPPVPAAPPPVILGPNGQPLPAMAGGGVVTQPTVALIGEAGPEAVVPLNGATGPSATLQPAPAPAPTPDPDLSARLGNTPGPDVTPPTPTDADIRNYIAQAAKARGIDPNVAIVVAQHEGTNPKTGQFDSPAQEGSFTTGHSFWPLQLHYGGPGYEQYGTTAGMGNDFTAQTGWQPGDPRAWQDATNYALDQALQYGWGRWYGSIPAKVAPTQGLPPTAPVVKGRSRGA